MTQAAIRRVTIRNSLTTNMEIKNINFYFDNQSTIDLLTQTAGVSLKLIPPTKLNLITSRYKILIHSIEVLPSTVLSELNSVTLDNNTYTFEGSFKCLKHTAFLVDFLNTTPIKSAHETNLVRLF
jgi:hypothetical protein